MRTNREHVKLLEDGYMKENMWMDKALRIGAVYMGMFSGQMYRHETEAKHSFKPKVQTPFFSHFQIYFWGRVGLCLGFRTWARDWLGG